jgi:DNA-binding transcriptional LysR family regulator
MKKNIALLNPNLEAFMAVAQHKTVHAGARAIHISQTAMTQRIQNLEEKLGTTLFVRTRQGMQLTTEGGTLLHYCHTVSQLSKEALIDIMDAGSEFAIRVNISGPSSIMASRIIPACLPLMKKFPQLYINFDIDDTKEIITTLNTGLSQFIIIPPEQISREVRSKSLKPDKYLLVCSKAWKKRKLLDILQTERIIDFDESDYMTHHYLRHFDLLKHAQPERLFVNRTDSLLKMFSAGFGYGVLTEEFAHTHLKSGELVALNAAKTYDCQMSLVWYDRPEPPKYFSAIMDAII